jgi:uncharacterized protein YkwD
VNIVAFLVMLGAVVGAAAVGRAGSEPGVEQLERAIGERIDEIRHQHGLPGLERDPTLTEVAREYSCRMAEEDFFAHRAPSNGTVGDRVREAGREYRMVGENLAAAVNVPDPVATVVGGWMDSEGHRENILRAAFTHTGVGVCDAEPGYYVTQIFLRPR